jgi:ribosomal protein S18 acetylase RimI-like enzyme
MHDNLILRPAQMDDLAAIISLQHAAYAKNRPLLGVEPLPLLADYREVMADREIWLATEDHLLKGVLILSPEFDGLLIWSVATAPEAEGRGIGRKLLMHAESLAAERQFPFIRLYTGEPLTHNIAWYSRNGYSIEKVEQMKDRRIVHMIKPVDGGQ